MLQKVGETHRLQKICQFRLVIGYWSSENRKALTVYMIRISRELAIVSAKNTRRMLTRFNMGPTGFD